LPISRGARCPSCGGDRSVGRSGWCPCPLPCGARAALRSCHQVRISGAAARRRAGSRPERRNPLHPNIIKYPLQQGQNLRTPCSSRCCARLIPAPALSACRPPSPLSRASLPTRPSPPVACQTPSSLPSSSLRLSKNSAPPRFYGLWSQCASASERGTPLPPPSQTDVCLVHFCSRGKEGAQPWNVTGSRHTGPPEPGWSKGRGESSRGISKRWQGKRVASF